MSSAAPDRKYHIGFGAGDLPDGTTLALLSGDPGRSALIAGSYLSGDRLLASNRGLDAHLAQLPNGTPVVCATSGMGGPSTSIVVNELVSVGIRTIIRVGTAGTIQPHIAAGDAVVVSASLANQGAADDIAPPQYPAAADPFLTVELSHAADELAVPHHVGIMASTDTFFEGQGRSESSANPYLQRRLQGLIEEYEHLNVLGFEMEAGLLFKMGGVYGFAAAAVVGIVAQRTADEQPVLARKDAAIDHAIRIAVRAADRWTGPARGTGRS